MISALSGFVLALLSAAEPTEGFQRAAPECPAAARHCFGVHLHVVVEDGRAVQRPEWFAEQVREATRLFDPLGVAFEVADVDVVEADRAEIETRLDRDLLGRKRFTSGVVHVFVVRRLADVDVEGAEIRGVHWRDRYDTSRRWIILSSIGRSRVLAHELGHFFGLPHSTYGVSIMNKRDRAQPKWSERRFAAPEIERMRARLRRLLTSGALNDRKK